MSISQKGESLYADVDTLEYLQQDCGDISRLLYLRLKTALVSLISVARQEVYRKLRLGFDSAIIWHLLGVDPVHFCRSQFPFRDFGLFECSQHHITQ